MITILNVYNYQSYEIIYIYTTLFKYIILNLFIKYLTMLTFISNACFFGFQYTYITEITCKIKYLQSKINLEYEFIIITEYNPVESFP